MDRLNSNTHSLLNEQAILALYQQGIYTEKDFIFCDTQKLAKISLLVFKEILEIKKILVKKNSASPTTAYDIYMTSLQNSAIISSGIQSIDQILEGGLLTNNIYEICGGAASGKSLFAFAFMKNIVLRMKQKCFLLDTKNDFCAHKFTTLCTGYSTDNILVGLSNIYIKSIDTKYDLINSLQEIAQNLENNTLTVRLIVIDSLPAVILNSNDHSHNNLILNHLANVMHYISYKFDVVFLITNLVTVWAEDSGFSTENCKTSETIACGRFWYSVPNTRIKIKKDISYFKLSIEKSNLLPQSTSIVPLTDFIPTIV